MTAGPQLIAKLLPDASAKVQFAGGLHQHSTIPQTFGMRSLGGPKRRNQTHSDMGTPNVIHRSLLVGH